MHTCCHLNAIVSLRCAGNRNGPLCPDHNQIPTCARGSICFQGIVLTLYQRLAIVCRDGKARSLRKAGRLRHCRRLHSGLLFRPGLPCGILCRLARLRFLFFQRRFISRSFRLMRQCTVGRLFTSRAALPFFLRLPGAALWPGSRRTRRRLGKRACAHRYAQRQRRHQRAQPLCRFPLHVHFSFQFLSALPLAALYPGRGKKHFWRLL